MQAIILDATSENFESAVVANSYHLPVLVDFWAPWCGPCKQIMPQLEALAQELAGRFVLAKVNTEEQPQLADVYRIQSIPSLKIFHQGRVVHEMTGAQPIATLKKLLDKYLPADPIEEIRTAFAGFVEAGDAQNGLSLLEKALREHGPHPHLCMDLMDLLMKVERYEAARNFYSQLPEKVQQHPEIILRHQKLSQYEALQAQGGLSALQAVVDQNPQDLAAQIAWADGHFALDDPQRGFEILLEVFVRDRSFEEGLARKKLLGYFEQYKTSHTALVNQYRQRLMGLMF